MDRKVLETLQTLYPYNQLTLSGMESLTEGLSLHDVKSGESLQFMRSTPGTYYYLLQGRIVLAYLDADSEEFHTDTSEIVALPDQENRRFRAKAVLDSRLLGVSQEKLDEVLQKDQPNNPRARHFKTASRLKHPSWKETFLMASGFKYISREVLDQAFSRMDAVTVKEGDVIIRQGEMADFFYIIAKGRCEVIRESEIIGKSIKLVEYGPGASLGEDALVSNLPRNATVRMLTDGKLMRLDGDDFRFHFKIPLTRSVSLEQAREMINEGVKWLDVRMPSDIEGGRCVKDSINIPHAILRTRLFTADPNHRYVVICNDGSLSAAMTFSLSKYGYEAYYLENGLKSLPDEFFDYT